MVVSSRLTAKVVFGNPKAIAEQLTSLPTGQTINTSFVERNVRREAHGWNGRKSRQALSGSQPAVGAQPCRRLCHGEQHAPESTGEVRGKPPRGWALRPHGEIKRSGVQPTGNNAPVSRPCLMGQRVGQRVGSRRAAHRGTSVMLVAKRMTRTNRVYPVSTRELPRGSRG